MKKQKALSCFFVLFFTVSFYHFCFAQISDEELAYKTIYAARKGDVKTMETLLTQYKKPDIYFGKTNALAEACRTKNLEIVKLLLKFKVNLNLPNGFKNRSALMYAVLDRELEILKLLLQYKPNLNLVDHDGKTALIYACQNGRDLAIELLVEAGADLNKIDSQKATALDYACLKGREKAASYLIIKGASLKHLYPNVQPYVIYAAVWENPALVKVLLAKGADPNAYFTHEKGKYYLLMMLAAMGDTENLNKAIEMGGDVNKIDPDKNTALMYACKRQHYETVLALLKAGANVNLKGALGTALGIACKREDPKIAKLLLSYKADTSLLDEEEKEFLKTLK